MLYVARSGRAAQDAMPGCELVLIGVPEVEIAPLLDAVSARATTSCPREPGSRAAWHAWVAD